MKIDHDYIARQGERSHDRLMKSGEKLLKRIEEHNDDVQQEGLSFEPIPYGNGGIR